VNYSGDYYKLVKVSVLCVERLCAINRVVLKLWKFSYWGSVVFSTDKENCLWDREMVEFHKICKLRRGNV